MEIKGAYARIVNNTSLPLYDNGHISKADRRKRLMMMIQGNRFLSAGHGCWRQVQAVLRTTGTDTDRTIVTNWECQEQLVMI